MLSVDSVTVEPELVIELSLLIDTELSDKLLKSDTPLKVDSDSVELVELSELSVDSVWKVIELGLPELGELELVVTSLFELDVSWVLEDELVSDSVDDDDELDCEEAESRAVLELLVEEIASLLLDEGRSPSAISWAYPMVRPLNIDVSMIVTEEPLFSVW